jgi:CRISPR-associated exonuclease Cas4
MFPDPPTNEPASDHALEWLPPEHGLDLVTVTLLKQYTYCPRVVYYETCTPGIRPTTYKMQAGQAAHERERERAARRKLSSYQLQEGERRFDVRLASTGLGLSGLIDEVVLHPQEAIVIDYKLTDRAGDNHIVQVAAYALLVEEAFKLPVRRGYIYLMQARQFEMVAIEADLRNSVWETLNHIQRIRLYEYMPPPADQPNKCKACEFRRFCNDVRHP